MWEIDLSKWKLKQLKEWNRAIQSGDMDKVIRAMATIIKKWPFAGDPSKSDDYDELRLDEWGATQQKVVDAIGEIFQRKAKDV